MEQLENFWGFKSGLFSEATYSGAEGLFRFLFSDFTLRLLGTADRLLIWAGSPPFPTFGKGWGNTLVHRMGTLNGGPRASMLEFPLAIIWFHPYLISPGHLLKRVGESRQCMPTLNCGSMSRFGFALV